MTTNLRRCFDIIAAAERPLSATDVRVRLPVDVDNTRKYTTALRAQGKIEEVYRLRREKFYVSIPGVDPPTDGRPENARHARAVRKQKLAMKSRARKVRRA